MWNQCHLSMPKIQIVIQKVGKQIQWFKEVNIESPRVCSGREMKRHCTPLFENIWFVTAVFKIRPRCIFFCFKTGFISLIFHTLNVYSFFSVIPFFAGNAHFSFFKIFSFVWLWLFEAKRSTKANCATHTEGVLAWNQLLQACVIVTLQDYWFSSLVQFRLHKNKKAIH